MESDSDETEGKASSEDILGQPAQRRKIDPKWQKHYERLERLRDSLLDRKSLLVEDAAEEKHKYTANPGDAGTDEYDMNLALSMASAEQDALNEIQQAMSRILDGTYGTCQLTGLPIDPERLKAVPWTRFSKEAEEKLEREGKVQKASLGAREKVARQNTTGSVGQQGLNTSE